MAVRAQTPVDLSRVPTEQILSEARKRTTKLKAELGPYATLKKMRKCRGCKETGTTRWLRSHECPSGLSWPKR